MADQWSDFSPASQAADQWTGFAPANSATPSTPTPAPTPQTSQSLGFLQGIEKPWDHLAVLAKGALNKVDPGLADSIDNFGQREFGLPTTDQMVQSHADYITQQAKKGIVPGGVGRFAGEVVGTAPLAAIAPEALSGGALVGLSLSNAHNYSDAIRDAAFGAAASKIGETLIGSAADALPSSVSVPTTDAIKNASRAAYKAADGSPMIVRGDATRDLVNNIQTDLTNKGFDASLHPKTAAVFDRLQQAATDPTTNGNVTLQGMDVLRKVAGQAAQSTDPADKFMGRVVQNHIDDFVGGLTPNDVVGGTVDQGSIDSLQNARSLWNTAAKSEIIDNVIQRAQNNSSMYNAAGSENALRTSFRQLSNNQRVMTKFNPDEQQAIRTVAQGGPVGNALRFLGKFAPHGYLSTVLGGGAALELGGVPAAAGLFAGGEAARVGAKIATQRNANAVSALVRNGGTLPQQVPGYASKILTLAKTPTSISGPPLLLPASSNGNGTSP